MTSKTAKLGLSLVLALLAMPVSTSEARVFGKSLVLGGGSKGWGKHSFGKPLVLKTGRRGFSKIFFTMKRSSVMTVYGDMVERISVTPMRKDRWHPGQIHRYTPVTITKNARRKGTISKVGNLPMLKSNYQLHVQSNKNNAKVWIENPRTGYKPKTWSITLK